MDPWNPQLANPPLRNHRIVFHSKRNPSHLSFFHLTWGETTPLADLLSSIKETKIQVEY